MYEKDLLAKKLPTLFFLVRLDLERVGRHIAVFASPIVDIAGSINRCAKAIRTGFILSGDIHRRAVIG